MFTVSPIRVLSYQCKDSSHYPVDSLFCKCRSPCHCSHLVCSLELLDCRRCCFLQRSKHVFCCMMFHRNISLHTALIDDCVTERRPKSRLASTTVSHTSGVCIACSKDTATCLIAVVSILATTTRCAEEKNNDEYTEQFSAWKNTKRLTCASRTASKLFEAGACRTITSVSSIVRLTERRTCRITPG